MEHSVKYIVLSKKIASKFVMVIEPFPKGKNENKKLQTYLLENSNKIDPLFYSCVFAFQK
jgi:hypothetical protein